MKTIEAVALTSRAAVIATVLVALAACGAASRDGASPKVYILDCGTMDAIDPQVFGLKKEEVKSDGSLVTPCYLIVHPKGTLVWDTGQIPDERIKDDGTQTIEHGALKARHRLTTQLAALGFTPASITYLAMSHYHADHTANANLFAKSTWIVQRAEYDIMFSNAHVDIREPEHYDELKNAKRIMLNHSDHDVFGDGTVVVKTAPGHTPGHQMLFLKLKNYGPLLIAGDLYHLPEEKTLDRVPTFEFDATMTRVTRKKVDVLLEKTGATMWIQHDPTTNSQLKKSPAYYD